jgi:two-component system response regulator HupR/HoxA
MPLWTSDPELHNPRTRPRIALVDDEKVLIESLLPLLEPDFEVLGFPDAPEALEYLSLNPVAVVVSDYRMPKMDGIEFLACLRKSQPDTVRILFTAFGDLNCLTRAINSAAVFHYISKERLSQPEGVDEIVNLLHQAAELYATRTELKMLVRKVAAENEALESDRDTLLKQRPHSLGSSRSFSDLVGNSPAIRDVIDKAKLANQLGYDVHIAGETGTGKEILAQALHFESVRRNKPFIAVNCGGLAKEIVASEFFGHTKGSFTGAVGDRKGVFESANGGTVFLDEIGELPVEVQPMLLRVLQEREVCPLGSSKPRAVDVRVISATNRSLMSDAQNGGFRSDLFYRLRDGVEIVIPPLSERPGDVGLLAQHFFRKSYHGTALRGISDQALALLESLSLPGNVRDLMHLVKEATLVALQNNHSRLEIADFVLPPTQNGPSHHSTYIRPEAGGPRSGLRDRKRAFARAEIEDALRENDWHITRTAHGLGISREWLSKLMKQYELSRPSERP